jgi:hypothetical protein
LRNEERQKDPVWVYRRKWAGSAIWRNEANDYQ